MRREILVLQNSKVGLVDMMSSHFVSCVPRRFEKLLRQLAIAFLVRVLDSFSAPHPAAVAKNAAIGFVIPI